MMRNEFYKLLESRGLVLSNVQRDEFHHFFKRLVEWNDHMNLTGITDEYEVYAKHFYDSLDPFLEMDMSRVKTVCDVGTGAGFPGMPLAIAYPQIHFCLIDSLGKRIDFLNFCIKELGMTNVCAIHVRAEEFTAEKREHFDLVTSRAVARLHILAELCAPLVRVGGNFVTLKGPAGYAEFEEAGVGPTKLGLTHQKIINTSLNGVGERVNIYFKKTTKTPREYPRQFRQIKKKPLI